MARYIKWDDVVARYPDAGAKDANELKDHYINYAEAEINGRLSNAFTVPFSDNNLTVKELAIDLSYAKSLRGRNEKFSKPVRDGVDERIKRLLDGSEVMITTSGDAVVASVAQAWSNTESYQPAFDKESVLDQEIDPDEQQDEYDARI